jgi:methyltransferase-like protein 6
MDRKRVAVDAVACWGDEGIRRILDGHTWVEAEDNNSSFSSSSAAVSSAEAQAASAAARRERIVGQSMDRWDRFFERNKTAFYKDKHHLRGEFAEMMTDEVRTDPKRWRPPLVRAHSDLSQYPFDVRAPPPSRVYADKLCFLELGCGVGNAAFPLLRANPELFGFCADFSQTSIRTLQARDEYDPDRLYAFCADVTRSDQLRSNLPTDVRGNLRFVTAVWVLSALDPDSLPGVIQTMKELLAPGGMVMFRDYAVGDLSQLRLDPGESQIGRNFYMVGDGTLRYFFDPNVTRTLFEQEGFQTVDLQVIRRCIRNHKEDVNMQRFWIQGKFRKPVAAGDAAASVKNDGLSSTSNGSY